MDTRPIDFDEANGTLSGTDDVDDLPVYRDGEHTISCWHIPFWKRIKLLFTGNVWLCVKSQSHPPLWLDTECFEDDQWIWPAKPPLNNPQEPSQ
jgi:hypothetical protein